MKIAYLMSRFPHLPETFILREMQALEARGWKISLYPLLIQDDVVVHEDAKAWVPRAHSSPVFAFRSLIINLQWFARHPGVMLKILFHTIRENLSSLKFLLRALVVFPKAIVMAEQMQAEDVEHIHAHYASHPALAAWIIHKLTGISYSVTVHAHDIFVEKVMLATKLGDASFIVAISAFNRRYLKEKISPALEEKTVIVHCGISPEHYQPPKSGRLALETSLEIITTGSLEEYKGQKYLIEACEILKAREVPFRCRIIGGGELHDDLARRISKAGLESQVQLLGSQTQTEVRSLLATANCYVQPSIITSSGKMEGIPVAIMEAMASDLPVVATQLSGIPEIVQPGKTGYLVPPEDPAQLADAFAHLHQHPEEAARFSRAGQVLVLEEFNLHTNISQLADIFFSLITTEKSS